MVIIPNPSLLFGPHLDLLRSFMAHSFASFGYATNHPIPMTYKLCAVTLQLRWGIYALIFHRIMPHWWGRQTPVNLYAVSSHLAESQFAESHFA